MYLALNLYYRLYYKGKQLHSNTVFRILKNKYKIWYYSASLLIIKLTTRQ